MKNRRQFLSRGGRTVSAYAASCIPFEIAGFAHTGWAEEPLTLFSVIKKSGHAPAFIQAVVAAGLKDLFSATGSTVFVPLGSDLTGFPGTASLDAISALEREDWRKFVTAHVVLGIHHATELIHRKTLFRSLAKTTIVLDAFNLPPVMNGKIKVEILNPPQTGMALNALHWINKPLAALPKKP